MEEKNFLTQSGRIHYWISEIREGPTLVFLPGQMADHRLFDRQFEHFSAQYTCLVWDAPGHNASRPFGYNYTLMDEAIWLHNLLQNEGLHNAILIAQGEGGYVAQCYMQRYPNWLLGFVAIGSAPLQSAYFSGRKLRLLKHAEIVYKLRSWAKLKEEKIQLCSASESGKALAGEMLGIYDKQEYCRLAAFGDRLLLDAVQEALPYTIDCPAMLVVGEHDEVDSALKVNRRWAKETGLPLQMVPAAAHYANVDNSECVNTLITEYIESLPKTGESYY